MRTEHFNRAYLDRVLSGETVDVWYHLGTTSADTSLPLLSGLHAVVVAGSGHRIERMAQQWGARRGTALLLKFAKDERFTMYYTNGVLFSSHGMGMPSASIAIQELMKLVYVVKGGDPAEMAKVFFCRVGTSGGLCDPGTVVVSTEGLQADLRPYRLLALGEEVSFDPAFPSACADAIVEANAGAPFPVIKGATIGCNSFYIEQNRVDGAIALCDDAQKLEWLKRAHARGVRNIEMEAPMLAGFLNHWGFPRFATVCCTLVDRLRGDQVTATAEELKRYSENAETALWNYLESPAYAAGR